VLLYYWSSVQDEGGFGVLVQKDELVVLQSVTVEELENSGWGGREYLCFLDHSCVWSLSVFRLFKAFIKPIHLFANVKFQVRYDCFLFHAAWPIGTVVMEDRANLAL